MKPKRHGFTLIEMLVVIAIIMILIGLLVPAFSKVKDHAKKVRANAEARQIETAWKAYLADHRVWGGAPVGSSARQMGPTEVAWLQGANPKGIMYLEIQASALVSGYFVDPWKRAYEFAVDTDYDNQVPLGPTVAMRSVAVWSLGRNGTRELVGGDDIQNW
jgi:prepilin-type N-terminal cleavage/methylation domain-containing protein